VIRRGAQINPVNVMLPAGRKLEGSDLARFREARADMNLQVANVAPVTRVARAQAAQ
jgi:hypothetical protein